MSPTPFEPIRPVGSALDSELYVARAEHAARVHRRERPSSDGGGSRQGQQRSDEQGAPRAEAEPAATDAGIYDDHGRTDDHDHRPHLDLSA